MRSKNGSNLKHLCLSENEKRWQTKQEKMIKAHNGARSHALNHSSKLLIFFYNNTSRCSLEVFPVELICI